jgi:hypothetical protein
MTANPNPPVEEAQQCDSSRLKETDQELADHGDGGAARCADDRNSRLSASICRTMRLAMRQSPA